MKKYVIILSILIYFPCFSQENLAISDGEIYSIALTNVIGKDDTYNGQLNPKLIYISKELAPGNNKIKAKYITEDAKAFVSEFAKNNNLKVRWVKNSKSIQYSRGNGEIVGGGVLIDFSEIKYISETEAEIDASIYVASEAAGGTHYVLTKKSEHWALLSSKPTWISYLFKVSKLFT
jgi:hypothetical protein